MLGRQRSARRKSTRKSYRQTGSSDHESDQRSGGAEAPRGLGKRKRNSDTDEIKRTTRTGTNNTKMETDDLADNEASRQDGTGRSSDDGSPPNKRQRTRTVSESDEKRYETNVADDRAALKRIYREFYDSSGWIRSSKDRPRDVYGVISKGGRGYLKRAISTSEFYSFAAPNEYYKVESQHYPKNPARALRRGDYFYVINRKYKKQDLTLRRRRIIVNANTQQAGLRVAKALNELFKDRALAQRFDSYKVYLSSTANPDKEVKYDKLVIYYSLDDNDAGDTVGDRIIQAIDKAVPPRDRTDKFAPFYSRIGDGVAWAEEPGYFIKNTKGISFTESRANIIEDVIKRHPRIRDFGEFGSLVAEAFERGGVDPDRPHRHLVSAGTNRKT
jgi:hypothetical protein